MTPMFRIIGRDGNPQVAVISIGDDYDLRGYEAFLAEGTEAEWESLRVFGGRPLTEPPEISYWIAKVWENQKRLAPAIRNLTDCSMGTPREEELAGLKKVVEGYTEARDCYITLLAANG